jgi:hypothetical protein
MKAATVRAIGAAALAGALAACGPQTFVAEGPIEGCYSADGKAVLELSAGKVTAFPSREPLADYKRVDDANGTFITFSRWLEVQEDEAGPRLVVVNTEPFHGGLTSTGGKLTIPLPKAGSDLDLVRLVRQSNGVCGGS